jgi:hypothetical protein
MDLQISTEKTAQGRRGVYQFSFDAIPMRFELEDYTGSTGGETIDVRRYSLEANVETTRQWAKFTEQRSVRNGGLPSYSYDVVTYTGDSKTVRPITFLKAYQDALESNYVDLFAELCKYPSKFPAVDIQ